MKKFKWTKRLGLLAVPLTLAACGNNASTAESTSEQANSEWPEEITVIQFANEENPNTPTAHDGFSQHLENELGITVNEFTSSGSYSTSIEAMSSGEVEIMLVSPQSFAAAQEKADAELFATIDQDTDYHSMFVTQADNDEINSMEDLEGTNFAFADPTSSSGYLYPKATLVSELGLDPNRIEESGYFFNNIAFSGAHNNSLLGVSMGDYDAAAVASTAANRLFESGAVSEEDIKVVGQSVDIPNASYVVRGDLPEDFKQAVQDAFLSFDDSEYFDTIYGNTEARFTEIDDSYYAPAVEAMEIVDGSGEE